MKYRKKPIIIDAVIFDGTGSIPELELFMIDTDSEWICSQCGKSSTLHGNVKTLEGYHIACPGDYILTGIKGEHYPCKPDIFKVTYEEVSLELERTMNANVTIKFRFNNICSSKDLDEISLDEMVKYLIQEEGIGSFLNDDNYKIINVEEVKE
jgi:hypothetical protein